MNDQTGRRGQELAALAALLAVRRRALPRPDGRDRSLLQPAPRRPHPRAPRRSAHEPAVLHLARRARSEPGLAVSDRPRARLSRRRDRRDGAAQDGVRARDLGAALSRRAPAGRAPGGGRRGAGARRLGGRAALRRAPAPLHLPRSRLPAAGARARRGRTAARALRARPAGARLGQRQLLLLPGPGRARALRGRRRARSTARRRAPRGAARRSCSCRSSSPRRRARARSPTSPTTGGCPGCGRCRSTATASWPLDGPFFFVAAGVLLATALPGRRLALAAARRWRSASSARAASASSPSSPSSAARSWPSR